MLLVDQVFGAALFELVEAGGPASLDFAERFASFDGIQSGFVSEQSIEFIDFDLLRIRAIEDFGDADADVHDVAPITVGQQNGDAAALLAFEFAVAG